MGLHPHPIFDDFYLPELSLHVFSNFVVASFSFFEKPQFVLYLTICNTVLQYSTHVITMVLYTTVLYA